MIPNVSPLFGRRFWVLAMVVCISRSAAAGFDGGRSYQAPTDNPGWSWSLGLTPSGDGYSFTASSATTNGGSILALTRLDGDGAVDWALQATNGPMGYTTLQADAAEALVFAKIDGLAAEPFWSVFGVFDGRTGARIYERGFPVIVDQNSPGSYFAYPPFGVQGLAGGRAAVLVDGSWGKVHLAVLDRLGKTDWSFTYQASSFATVYAGATSRLIEDPGRGYWLLVWGTKRITVEPNPPPINTGLTVNILRLDLTGKVVWTKSLAGISVSSLNWRGPAVVGPDGSLALTLSDTVIDASGIPKLTDVVTYLLLVDAQGKLKWARRLGRVNLSALNFDRGDGTLFVSGAKIVSLTAVETGERFVARLNPLTGETVKALSFKSTDLEVAEISHGRLFVRAYGSAQGPVTTALVGALNTNLESGVWRKFDREVGMATLALAADGANLLFSSLPANEARLLAIPLDFDLLPAASDGRGAVACASFSEVANSGNAITFVNAALSLTERSVILLVNGATLPLLPTSRIHLERSAPTTGLLCTDASPDAPPLSAWSDSVSGSFRLRFAAQRGVAYDLLFTSDLGQPFAVIETVTADSAAVERALPAKGNGFYAVRQRR